MKMSKYGNLIRAIALFAVAVALVGTISFAASGWQSATNPDNNSGDVDLDNNDADNDKEHTPSTPAEDLPYIPKYVSYITGLEITEEEYFTKPICFAINATGPMYGISSAEMVFEIPTENGDTRLLAYMNAKKLPGKIGSIAPTRKYIDNIVKYFGGVLIANGNDDSIKYAGFDIKGSSFDLAENSDYRYTGFTNYIYTNNDLITSGVISSGIASYTGSKESFPYKFIELGQDVVLGSGNATNIEIQYNQSNKTQFSYSKTTSKYTLSKSGEVNSDLLNGKPLEFDNVFLLFADATTYETATASEMVLDTASQGCGKYMTNGTYVDITWSVDASGNLVFLNTESQILTVNRGTSYISFIKSSQMNNIEIS